jgi:hypothetical protein
VGIAIHQQRARNVLIQLKYDCKMHKTPAHTEIAHFSTNIVEIFLAFL